MRNLIEGYAELEKKLEYEPNFHDDYIEKVTITRDKIEFDLKTVDGGFYSLIFEDVREINLKGEFLGEVGIIFALDIEQTNNGLKTTIEESLGLFGEITSGKIIVK